MQDAELIRIVPSARQLALQKMAFYAFVHFTVNTFTDREWGDGTEDPALFNPSELNPDQWVESIRAAGMKVLLWQRPGSASTVRSRFVQIISTSPSCRSVTCCAVHCRNYCRNL